MKKRFLNLALALSRQKAETNFGASYLFIYEDLHYIMLCYIMFLECSKNMGTPIYVVNCIFNKHFILLSVITFYHT